MACKIFQFFGLSECCEEKNILQTTLKSNFMLDSDTSESQLSSFTSGFSELFESAKSGSSKILKHIRKNDLVKLNISIGKKKIKNCSYYSADSNGRRSNSLKMKQKSFNDESLLLSYSSRQRSNYEKLSKSIKSSIQIMRYNQMTLENKALLLQRIKNDREVQNSKLKHRIAELTENKALIAFKNLKHMRDLLLGLKNTHEKTSQTFFELLQKQLIQLNQEEMLEKYNQLKMDLTGLKEQKVNLERQRNILYTQIDQDRLNRLVLEIQTEVLQKEMLSHSLTKNEQFEEGKLKKILNDISVIENYIKNKSYEKIKQTKIIQKIKQLQATSFYEDQLFRFQLDEINQRKKQLIKPSDQK